jgi:hypothetical protein
VDESLDGFVAAFDGCRRIGRGGRVIARAAGAVPGRVGVVTGGGFGHLPLFAGYVAEGMLDACAVGNGFAGPPADVCGETLRAADGGAGVACVLGNYGGDRMSFAEACDDFEDGGGRTVTVIVADDVASASKAEAAKRRGVAGMVLAFKAAGASAAQIGASAGGAAATNAPAAATVFGGMAIVVILVSLAYFLIGFLFYATLFAAAGSMVSSDQEAQQAAQPIIILLMTGWIFVNPVLLNPNGKLAVILSWLPWASPIIMPIRMGLTSVSPLSIAGSMLVALLGSLGAVWLAARIYRVGMLMYGKRPTFAELAKWIRYA